MNEHRGGNTRKPTARDQFGSVRTDAGKVTVGAWLDDWVDTYCIGLKPRTIALYKETVPLRIKPHIGAVELQQLTNVVVIAPFVVSMFGYK